MWWGLACVTGGGVLGTDATTTTSTWPTGSTPSPTVPLTDGLDVVSGLWAELSPEVGTVVRVGWDQTAPAVVAVEFWFDDEAVRSSPARALDAGAHEDLLLGLPYEVSVNFRLVVDGVAGMQNSIETEDLPGKLPVPSVETSEPSLQDPAMAWVYTSLDEDQGFTARWWGVILDRQGRPVWGVRTDARRVALHPRLSWDGRTLLFEQNSYWGAFDGGAESVVHRLSIDGTILQTWVTPGLHHPYQEMPDGSLAYAHMVGPYADDRIDIVAPDGTHSELFSCDAFLLDIGQFGYCGSNTLNYDEERDSFLFSFYSFDSVIEVDATTGVARRWWGHIKDAWRFDPAESAFWWQHGPEWTPDGTLLLSTRGSENGDETVVREYALDEASSTLVEVWNFGVGRGVYGAEMGEAHRLPGGNTLHNYGTNARLIEATPDGTVAWDLAWGTEQTLGRSTPIEDIYSLAGDLP